MSTTDPRIELLLSAMKAEARSSPAGLHWSKFHELLRTERKSKSQAPPPPLILGASGESNGHKLQRLAQQLGWALKNDCLDEAIRYLQGISAENWNVCPADRWDEQSY